MGEKSLKPKKEFPELRTVEYRVKEVEKKLKRVAKKLASIEKRMRKKGFIK